MSKIITRIFFILIFFTSFELFADIKPGSLTGLILDNETKGIVSGVNIILEYKKSSDRFKTESDLSGRYSFQGIPSGDYQLRITRLGYKTSIVDIFLDDGEDKKYDVYISPVEIEIEKINVTATKTEQTLQQTPSSISLVLSEEIKNKNKTTFDQVLEDVQGVTVNRTSGINVSALSIRGSSDVAGGGIGNRVLLLLDGRPSLTGDSKGALWSLIPVSIIERTEVVKGAFSSLYGSSAIGGVINVITKKPTYKPYTAVSFNAGFYEKLSDSLKFSDKLQSFKGINLMHSNSLKKISYLFNIDYKQNDGYAQQNDYRFYSGLGKFTFDLFGNRDLEFTLQYTNSESGYPHYWRQDPGKPADPFKVNPVYNGDKINKETQSIDVFYKAIPNSKTKYTSRFYYYKLYSKSSYNPQNPVSLAYGTPGQPFDNFITSYNFGNISQLDYNISDRHYAITGIDLQWNIVRSSPADILYGNQQQYNLGYFVQDQWNILLNRDREPVLSTTIGARFDLNKFIGSFEEKKVSPKISLLFDPGVKSGILDNTTYRILVGKAFRSPSIAELFFKKELFGGFDFVYNPNLKPEDMLSFEAGFRKQYKARFTLDVAAFINLYDNLIQYVNIGGAINGPFQVQNVAKAQIRGIEASVEYHSSFRMTNRLFKYSVNFDYTYIDAKDLSANRTDDFLPYKPRHVINGGVNLNFYGFNYNVNGRFVSKIDEVIFYKYEEPKSYFLLNMKLSKSITDKISIFAAVNNLTNKFYQELERIPAPNRNYNAGMNIEF
ncbi:MAG: TonB-dependent receptor [Ignavibacteria bacterium]|nr:TonB-dependent receptor [Ignavibacteria bacterium]